MAKSQSKSSKKDKSSRRQAQSASAASVLQNISQAQNGTSSSLKSLLERAQVLYQEQSSPEEALVICKQALQLAPTSIEALNLAGEISVQAGEQETAIKCFERAVQLDEDGSIDGPEKFLWLAQISQSTAEDSLRWYERGVTVLREWISNGKLVEERDLKQKLCSALCGMTEMFMSDLCMEPDAETRCEAYTTEALILCPDSSEALQTLASVRISQQRMDDAKAAVTRSYNLWKDLEFGDPDLPDYPIRLNFTSTLMECGMYDEAMEVLEKLQIEDDQMVDLWYLGGWCLYLMGSKKRETEGDHSIAVEPSSTKDVESVDADDWRDLWQASRVWLKNCEKLYTVMEWENEPVKEHMTDLLKELNDVLGEEMEESEGEDEGDAGWEDEDADEDENMDDEMKD